LPHYRGHIQHYKYLYSGWKIPRELRLKLIDEKIPVYIAFRRDFEVVYNLRNVVAVDVNENNVTPALFRET